MRSSAWLLVTHGVTHGAKVLAGGERPKFSAAGLSTVRRPLGPVLLGVFGLVFWMTLLKTAQFGTYYGLVIPSRAGRYLLPIGLLLVLASTRHRPERPSLHRATILLRLAIALTFLGHGIKALFRDGTMAALVADSQANVLGQQLFGPSAIDIMLEVIGVIDIAAAVLVLATRWRWVPLYMAAWTLLTATSRILANGIGSWDQVPIRAGYYCIPLALICLASRLPDEGRRRPDESPARRLDEAGVAA